MISGVGLYYQRRYPNQLHFEKGVDISHLIKFTLGNKITPMMINELKMSSVGSKYVDKNEEVNAIQVERNKLYVLEIP